MRLHLTRPIALVAVGTFAALALAGCSDDDPASSSAAAPVSATSTPSPSAASPSASSVAYRSLTNARYGFRCEVPADFMTGAESDNGDGVTSTSPDGKATVACFGSNNDPDVGSTSPQQERRQSVASHESDGDDVTLEVVTGNAVTVSGTLDSGDVFYERTLWGPGSTNTLRWTYPREDKRAYDAAVTRTAASFRAGTRRRCTDARQGAARR